MHFKPSRLEARAALNRDHHLVARQRAATTATTLDPFESFLSDIFGGGDTTTTSTTKTTRGVTTTTPSLSTVSTTSRTASSTSRTSTQPATTAVVVPTPPPAQSTARTTTVFSTSSSVDTGNTDASQANNSGSPSTGLPSVVIGIIVAASVIFGLIFVALIARKIFQSRRKNRRNTWARTSVISPFAPGAIITEKALPPPPPPEAPISNYPAYPPTAVAAAPLMSYAPQPYSPAAASSAGYPAPYPFGASGNGGANAPLMVQQNNINNTGFTAADLAGPVVIQHTPPTPTSAGAVGISVVKRTFVPSLPDELSISNGDQVRILSAYDDGWALCEKVANGEKGVVPQECLEMAKQTPNPSGPASEDWRLNRNSSLRRGQDRTY